MKRKLDLVPHDSRFSTEQTGKKMATAAAMTTAATAATTAIELNAREAQLKGLLLDVASFIDGEEEGGKDGSHEQVVLRWAGGWVRDKLLGQESHDIDTAINCMTGFAFAGRMQAFCSVAENAARHGMGPSDLGSLHKVEANPDKSKHLETATVRIFGMDVDFVNLRRESYAADSRNPQMEFGTAEEDALRRDATVNALFYNLHSGRVEDFTGGLADMAARRIKTPLEPLQTFTDDPLRVLRLVRFASRLSFTIDPPTEAVMADPRVLEALRLKISRERVGIEVEKMLKDKHPRDSLALIRRLGLYGAIFSDPAQSDLPHPDLAGWQSAYECLDHLAATKMPESIYGMLVCSEEVRYFAWVLAAIVPWETVERPRQPQPSSSKAKAKAKTSAKPPLPLPTVAVREGIRAPNKLCDVVTGAHRHRQDILALKQAVCARDSSINQRDRFGMAIRAWEAKGSNWRLQVLYALLAEVQEAAQKQGGSLADDERDSLLRGWKAFLDHLRELDVLDAPNEKRLLDGKQVAAALNIKPGPWMTAAMDVCMAWQLRHPGETDPAAAIEEVRQRKAEIGIANLLKD